MLSDFRAYRASLLRFDARPVSVDQSAHYEADGLLITATDTDHGGLRLVVASGAYHDLAPVYPDVPLTEWPGRIIAPGFVDMHLHYPQVDIIGSPAVDLLGWLKEHTFPAEMQFSDAAHAFSTAHFFTQQLLRYGITSAMAFATSHAVSVDALFCTAQQCGLRMITGKVLQDSHSPDGLRDDTETSLLDSERLIQRWHGQCNGRLGYALTPRFAPTSSAAQLQGAGELARHYPDVWIQSHVAETRAEVAWAQTLFPAARSYLGIYADAGLLRSRSVYAHCLYLDDADRQLMRQSGAAIAVCPTSNLFLGSGFFDFAAAMQAGCLYGLASDVGAGTTLNPFQTMLAAYYAGRESQTKAGLCLSAQHLWWQHTAGAATALDLSGQHTLMPGSEADFIVINPAASPLLARRLSQKKWDDFVDANSALNDLLFGVMVAGDDRLIERVILASKALS